MRNSAGTSARLVLRPAPEVSCLVMLGRGEVFMVGSGLFTTYRQVRAAIWIAVHTRTRSTWRIEKDLQDLARLLDKHGEYGGRVLARRARKSMARRDRAHWRRLHRMLEGCEFGLLPNPMTRAFHYIA